MGRRRFAKNSEDVRHFKLVTRSQNDQFADDPDAPPLVLEPCVRPGDMRRTGLSEAELMQIPESLAAKHPEAFVDPDAPPRDPNENVRQVRAGSEDSEEIDEDDLEGDCYFPKDGYNYDQHLKRVSGTGKGGGGVVGVVLNAPQTAETVPEEKLMNQEATCTEEAEVLRALEMVDEYEELEDGALEEILPGGVVDPTTVLWGPTAVEDSDLPDLAAFKAMHAARLGGLLEGEEDEDEEDEEGSDEDGERPAASSRRRAGETHPSADVAAAAEFEEFFAAEYGEEDDIGACEDEEIEGHMSLDKCEEVLDEYIDNKKKEFAKLTSLYEPQEGKLDDVPRVIEETKAIIERHYNNEGEDDESETDSGEESDSESRTWDCESVLSTLSNVSNRPGRIGKIKVVKKPAVAMKPVKEENENSEDEEADDDVVELPDVVTERPKNETAEEKRQRKAAVKEMRRICRKMKKESKETYKNETAKLADSKVGTGDIRHKSRTFRL